MTVTSLKVPKFRMAILLGLLSMFYGEVYAGSSSLWMLDWWSLFVTFPLYTFHTLFYLILAQRTKRTTLPHLYFWGLLFALYEAPITKVLWSGFPGSAGPGWGLVSGVAIMEFMIIVVFWHPVMSFMMPILTLEIFIQSAAGTTGNVIPSHSPLLLWNQRSKVFFITITFVASGPMALNNMARMIHPDLVLAASLCLVLIARAVTFTKSKGLTMLDFRFGNTGFTIIIVYLLCLYGFMTIILIPLTFPPIVNASPGTVIEGVVTIAIFAIIVCIVLRFSGPDALLDGHHLAPLPSSPSNQTVPMTIRHLAGLWMFMAGLIFLWSILPGLVILVILLLGLGFPILGTMFIVGMGIGLHNNTKSRTFIQAEGQGKDEKNAG